MFSWETFLDKHGVDWVAGPAKNVAAGMIGVNCPWCIQDSAHHLGINPKTGSYSCWKDLSHRGAKPYYLIQKIARCSKKEAEQLFESETYTGNLELREMLEMLDTKIEVPRLEEVSFTGNEFLLSPEAYSSKPFYDYLYEDRGFDDPISLAAKYKLRGCLQGRYRNRIVMPIFIDSKMVGWVARSINKTEPRYLSYPEGAQSVGKRVLYNYDMALKDKQKKAVVLVEGSFDALKLDAPGSIVGIRAVALLGLILTEEKVSLLSKLVGDLPLYIVLDKSATGNAIEILAKLRAAIPKATVLPFDVAKDPGALTENQALQWTKQLL